MTDNITLSNTDKNNKIHQIIFIDGASLCATKSNHLKNIAYKSGCFFIHISKLCNINNLSLQLN